MITSRSSRHNAGRPSAFTLIEVLVALVIFAMVVVVLGSAYLNVLISYEVVKRGTLINEDFAFARQQVLTEPDRKKLEELFVSSSQIGSMNYTDQSKARVIINDMNKLLKTQVKSIPGPVYVTCKKFLEGLMFTAAKCHLG